MEQTSKSIESEGFRAHIYLTSRQKSQSGWKYVASSKLTTVLAEKPTWETARTIHQRERVIPEQLPLDYDLAQRFRHLADQWHNETGHYSLMYKRAMHPAYQQIIGMGTDAISFILADLRERPTGHWFWALGAITGEDPTLRETDIDKAIQAWLKWRPKL